MKAIWFSVHLVLLMGAYVIPFMLDWQFVVTTYSMVVVQFLIFGKCLMNKEHALEEIENQTFYSYLMEGMGIQVNRGLVKKLVRSYLYILLMIVALYWQLWLGNEPWFSFL